MDLKDLNYFESGLLYISFNQDYSCFSVGTEKGFYVWNCEPHRKRFGRNLNGGIGIVEMLYKTNILALVGGGIVPKYPLNKVMIWDDYKGECIGEIELKNNIKKVKLIEDRIIIVTEKTISIFNFSDLQMLHQIETMNNPDGVCALSPKNHVLACPGLKMGYIHLESYGVSKTQMIKAHSSHICQVCLNKEGTLVATASEHGTLIRIFDVSTGAQIQEFRRGAERAKIYILTFNLDSSLLMISSSRGTVHVFNLDEDFAETQRKNKQSSLSFMKGYLPSYFSSEWSDINFKLSEPNICCFNENDTHALCVCADGTFYSYKLVKNGQCVQEIMTKFIDN